MLAAVRKRGGRKAGVYRPPAASPVAGAVSLWVAGPTACFTDAGGTVPAGVGDAVYRWNDSVGSNHLLQATASKRPTLQRDADTGEYYLKFDKRKAQFLAAAFTLNQPYTRLVTVRFQAAGAGNCALDGGTADTAYLSRQNNNNLQTYAGTSLMGAGSGTVSDGTTERVVQVFNGGSSALYLSGASVASGNAGSSNAGGVTVGSSGAGTFSEDCNVYRLGVYASAFDAATAALGDRWLVLAPSVPVPPASPLDGDGLLLAGTRSGLTVAANEPTKDGTNPRFETSPAAADHDKIWPSAVYDGSVKVWLGVGDNTGTPVLGWTYQYSADGRTSWTKPSLGQVDVGGSTANNFIGTRPLYLSSVDYDAARGRYGAAVEAWNDGGAVTGLRVYTSTTGTTFSLARALTTSPYDGEGGGFVWLPDGRARVYTLRGQLTSNRLIGYYESTSSDLTLPWVGWRYVKEWRYTSASRQCYKATVRRVRGAWWATMSMYDSGTERMWLEPWASADYGATWTQLATDGWLDLGTSGQWDDAAHIGGDVVPGVGSDDLLYFTGAAENHAAYPRTSQVGVAAWAAGRMVKATGAGGTLTTPPIPSPSGRVFRLTGNGTGGSLTAAVLDAAGSVVTGYATADMAAITGSVTGQAVTWGGNNLPASANTVRVTVAGSAELNGWSVA